MTAISDPLSLKTSISFTEFQHKSEKLKNVKDYTNCYFPFLGEKIRNRFYLPLIHLNLDSNEPVEQSDPHFFEKNSSNYLKTFAKMFKGQIEGIDPTFSSFEKFKVLFKVKDIPVKIESGDKAYLCNIRIVQSTGFEKESKGLRLILFSFYGNKEVKNGTEAPWDPKSLEAIGSLPLEILSALKTQIKVDSLICFSLGALTLDAVKDSDEDLLPDTIILDRGLTSIKKVAPMILSYPFDKIAHYLASCYHLDANPEESLPIHLEKIPPFKNKTVIVIEATLDRYFSKSAGYSLSTLERLKRIGAQVFYGQFLIPYLSSVAHHALRKDWIINNQNFGTHTKNFIPIELNEKLSDALCKYLIKEGKHTSFIVGGSRDTLDSMLYGAAPILDSYLNLN